jgi:hypothetical protein
MSTYPLNLIISQGTDFEITLTVRNTDGSPLNLLSYTGLSLLKKHYTSNKNYPFTLTFLDRLNGKISLFMHNSITKTLTEGRYVYDIILESPNNIKKRMIEGTVIVSPGVSF